MSKSVQFAGLKTKLAATAAGATEPQPDTPPSAEPEGMPAPNRPGAAARVRQRGGRRAKAETTTTAAARADKKAVVGYFHPDVNKWLRGKALAQDSTLQRVMFDLINMGRKADKLPPFPDEYESPEGA